MRRKLYRLLLAVLGVLMLLPAFTKEVRAEQPEYGSIRVVLEESPEGRSRQGVELSLYHCADLIDGLLVFREPYLDCAVDTADLSKPAIVRQTKEKLRAHLGKPIASARSSEEGTIEFENVPLGLYLIHTTDPAGYDQVGDLLVCLPAWNESEGEMEFHISVFAKVLRIPDILIEKTDPDRRAITGREFVFSAFEDEKTTRVHTIVPGDEKTGTARFSINLNQTLYIRETKAPQGYTLSEAVIVVRLSEDGQLFVNEQPVLPKDGVFRIVCVNAPHNPKSETRPPATAAGSQAAIWGAVALGSVVLLMVLIHFRRRR